MVTPLTIKNIFAQHHKVRLSSMLAFYIMHNVINNHHQTKSLFINVLCLRPEPRGSLTESPVLANVISSHLSTSWAHASGWDWAPAKLYHLISRLMPASKGEGGREVSAILGFQPIYKVCIGNYLMPTCPVLTSSPHPPDSCPQRTVKVSRAWWGKGRRMTTEGMRDAIMSTRLILLSLFPFLLFLPLYPWHFLSLSPTTCPPLSRLQSLSICLVILLHSFHIHLHFLPLGCPLLYPFPLCLPPLFWRNMASQSPCEI